MHNRQLDRPRQTSPRQGSSSVPPEFWYGQPVLSFPFMLPVPYRTVPGGETWNTTPCDPMPSVFFSSSPLIRRVAAERGGFPLNIPSWLVGAILFPSHFLFWGHELLLLAERVDTIPTGPFVFQHVLC